MESSSSNGGSDAAEAGSTLPALTHEPGAPFYTGGAVADGLVCIVCLTHELLTEVF